MSKPARKRTAQSVPRAPARPGVFISHSSVDTWVAEQLADQIRQCGADTFLPTAKEIAARVLHRPIGKVLAEICVDLGIMPRHPLWQALQGAIEEYGCNAHRVLATAVRRMERTTKDLIREARRLLLAPVPPDEPLATAATATGPP